MPYSRANEIVSYEEKSVGLTDGTYAGHEAVKWYAEQILKLDEQLAVIESTLHEKYKHYNPELCRVADGMHRRLDRVLEQKPVNDGVRNGLHLQKTNKNLRWYSVH